MRRCVQTLLHRPAIGAPVGPVQVREPLEHVHIRRLVVRVGSELGLTPAREKLPLAGDEFGVAALALADVQNCVPVVQHRLGQQVPPLRLVAVVGPAVHGAVDQALGDPHLLPVFVHVHLVLLLLNVALHDDAQLDVEQDPQPAGARLERPEQPRPPVLARLDDTAIGQHGPHLKNLAGPAAVGERDAVRSARDGAADGHAGVEGGGRLQRVA
mmetsp:Transcript_31809/g.101478  ORF Transcript_31809/g.101478 Transcript_31809/m.101478 type:complete len:213 (-) Transcript_31809:490-1128(-)|eukprot:scaffold15582_cov104-Isochrysis_galbana.AAC.5